MKFSIVIPLYNKAAYIGQTLASVLAQRLEDFEIVVVDDGSSDNGPDIVAACKDARLTLIRQDNAGVAAARNRGIAQAQGEWVCFLDADDWQHPEYLAGLSRLIKVYPHIDAVAARFKSVSQTWPAAAWPLPEFSHALIEDLPQRWMQGASFFTGSIAVRRSLLKKMQPCFAVGESCGEDLDLWFRIAERGPIALLEQPLSAYRIDVGDSLSRAHANTPAPYVGRMRQRALARTPDDPMRQSMLRYIAELHVTHALYDAAAGRRKSALQKLFDIFGSGWNIKRWWSTLLMTILLPARWIASWVEWRIRRTAA